MSGRFAFYLEIPAFSEITGTTAAEKGVRDKKRDESDERARRIG
jgi:hypothetical protein